MPLAFTQEKRSIIIRGLVLTLFLLVLCMVSSRCVALITGQQAVAPIPFFISRLMFWLLLAMVYLYVVKKEKQPLLLWAEKKYNIEFYIVSVIVILLSVIACSIIIHLIIRYLGWQQRSSVMPILLRFSLPLKLTAIVTAAFVEEMIFRGYLIPRLQLFFKNTYWPIIISTLIFGAVHIGYGTVVNVAGPILIGFIFAWHYQKYHSIKTLIICHFLIDSTVLFMVHQ
jgi:membrane protease YdiL (CAAX protease family)